ncbi:hypothetical protein [Ramlibacter algicola]|uniref:Uncharacterized protein n=1 Tax=Ramlibacter algicola TaxID=2795217 RepID=A0A934Q2E1_9BURK|nr:hypothetical protein [Ramlibacter algicola]MBK0394880.1 hypothetical protein [Ramlibacter algicola]
MKFADTAWSREHRFSIGRELESGRYYLSIPVANRLCDYEEYYAIDRSLHDGYPGNLPELVAFADRCRGRLCDDLLLVPAGPDRGVG